jgi:trehalose 6-phosphate phosphatase
MKSKYLFDSLEEFKEFKEDNKSAILIDIDGTISEITQTPEEAVVTLSMRNEIKKLKKKFQTVGIISGRTVENAMDMVGVDGLLYIGNHGMEYLIDGEIIIDSDAMKYHEHIKSISQDLKKSELSQIKGLKFEDKGICFSIHYRECESQEDLRKKILEVVDRFIDNKELKLTVGRKIVELKPHISRDKGYIVGKIIENYYLNHVIYIGDDITDYDAFTKLKELGITSNIKSASILVHSNEIPDYMKNSSLFYVKNVDEVQRFFKWISV